MIYGDLLAEEHTSYSNPTRVEIDESKKEELDEIFLYKFSDIISLEAYNISNILSSINILKENKIILEKSYIKDDIIGRIKTLVQNIKLLIRKIKVKIYAKIIDFIDNVYDKKIKKMIKIAGEKEVRDKIEDRVVNFGKDFTITIIPKSESVRLENECNAIYKDLHNGDALIDPDDNIEELDQLIDRKKKELKEFKYEVKTKEYKLSEYHVSAKGYRGLFAILDHISEEEMINIRVAQKEFDYIAEQFNRIDISSFLGIEAEREKNDDRIWHKYMYKRYEGTVLYCNILNKLLNFNMKFALFNMKIIASNFNKVASIIAKSSGKSTKDLEITDYIYSVKPDAGEHPFDKPFDA